MRKSIVMLVVLALSLSVLALAGCGGNGDAGGPKDVAERFIKATLAEDADAVNELLSAEDLGNAATEEDLSGAAELFKNAKVGSAKVSGDKAKVPVKLEIKELGMTLDFDMVLLDEDGSWKVSLTETEESMSEAFEKLFEDMENL